MNHKRRRHKNARAGCPMCKWYKSNGLKGTLNAQTFQERKARVSEKEQRAEL
jgi:uncharacterized protein YodC (DUF2158 family)